MKTIQLLILLNFFIFFKVAGQDSTNIELENMAKFNLSLTTVKIAYVPPKQYKKSYLSYNAIIGPMLLSGTRHQLEDIKDSIFVYFTVDGIDTSEKYISKMKRFGIPWDMNKNYLKTHSDTLKHLLFEILQPSQKTNITQMFLAILNFHYSRFMLTNIKDVELPLSIKKTEQI